MKQRKTIPEFDISKVTFDESWKDDSFGITVYYFTAPKEWVSDLHPEADLSEICLWVPIGAANGVYESVEIRPVHDIGYGLESYDAHDIVLPEGAVEALVALAEKRMNAPKDEGK